MRDNTTITISNSFGEYGAGEPFYISKHKIISRKYIIIIGILFFIGGFIIGLLT